MFTNLETESKQQSSMLRHELMKKDEYVFYQLIFILLSRFIFNLSVFVVNFSLLTLKPKYVC